MFQILAGVIGLYRKQGKITLPKSPYPTAHRNGSRGVQQIVERKNQRKTPVASCGVDSLGASPADLMGAVQEMIMRR